MPRRMKNKLGYSLVEMVIVMFLFSIVIAVAGRAFSNVARNAASQSRTAQGDIAGVVGLELMRVDIESAGYGLPWSFASAITYTEATEDPGVALNDAGKTYVSDGTQNNIPRAVMALNDVVSADSSVVLNGTDVLAIRSQSVATNSASKRWTYIESQVLPSVNPGPVPKQWSSSNDNLQSSDRIVMIQPIRDLLPINELVVNGTKWSTTYNQYAADLGTPRAYGDAEGKMDTYTIFGVDDSTNLKMPFNRADYYVRRPASSEQGWVRAPERCNSASGTLFKGVVQQSNGGYYELPLLECVLDMQVTFDYLRLADNQQEDVSPDIMSGFTAKQVRERVKEIKVYILTHDGPRDAGYTYPNSTIAVGPTSTYDFAAKNVPNWQNYRWRVYQVAGRPKNLANLKIE